MLGPPRCYRWQRPTRFHERFEIARRYECEPRAWECSRGYTGTSLVPWIHGGKIGKIETCNFFLSVCVCVANIEGKAGANFMGGNIFHITWKNFEYRWRKIVGVSQANWDQFRERISYTTWKYFEYTRVGKDFWATIISKTRRNGNRITIQLRKFFFSANESLFCICIFLFPFVSVAFIQFLIANIHNRLNQTV